MIYYPSLSKYKSNTRFIWFRTNHRCSTCSLYNPGSTAKPIRLQLLQLKQFQMLRSSWKTRKCTNFLLLNLTRQVLIEILLLSIVRIKRNGTFSCEQSRIAMSWMMFWRSLTAIVIIMQPKCSCPKLKISLAPTLQNFMRNQMLKQITFFNKEQLLVNFFSHFNAQQKRSHLNLNILLVPLLFNLLFPRWSNQPLKKFSLLFCIFPYRQVKVVRIT